MRIIVDELPQDKNECLFSVKTLEVSPANYTCSIKVNYGSDYLVCELESHCIGCRFLQQLK